MDYVEKQPQSDIEIGLHKSSTTSVNRTMLSTCETAKIERSFMSHNLNHLLGLYKMYSGQSSGACIVSGGLQQYVNKELEHRRSEQNTLKIDNHSCDAASHASCQFSYFDIMPVNIKLHIFSYLSARDLCRISQVCYDWRTLTEDNLLWQYILQRDVTSWPIIGHSTNPSLYKEVESDWSNKEIYIRCSPDMNQLMKKDNSTFHSISNVIKYFLPKKTPKVAMFGPGLETSTSKIVRKMLYDPCDLFQKLGMFPGQFNGVGAGMSLKMKSGQSFNLTVLYSASESEREQQQNQDRMQRSRLLIHPQNVVQMEAQEETYELTHSVRDLCRTLDAFIFIIDASTNAEAVNRERAELFAMVNERWSATHVPVLVLSCIKDDTCARLPCIEVVKALQLASLNRPWQVHDCIIENLSGVTEGIHWLVDQAQRK